MRKNLPPERPIEDLPPKAQRLREIGRHALGMGWQYRLAQVLGVGVKTVQRWATGDRECPDEVLVRVEMIAAAWERAGLYEMLVDIIRQAEQVPDFAIAASAHLADLSQRIKPSSEAPKDRRYKPKSPESIES